VGTNNYLVGNVGDWLRTTIEFEAGFYFKTNQTNPVTLTFDGILQRNSGSWIDDGFEIGDSVDVEFKYYLAPTGMVITIAVTSSIDDLTDTEMTLNPNPNTFNYDVIYPSQAVGGNPDLTALSLEVKTDKTPEEIELQYNQFPNDDISTAPQDSIIDGNKNVFIRQSVDGILTTMTEIGNKSGGCITTAQCRFVSKTDVWYKYEIVINHSIWGYFESLGNFLPNLLAPDYYDGNECLTDSFKLLVRLNNNDPNVVLENDLSQPLMQKLGNTGYFDENYNGQPNNYEIINAVWEDTSGNSQDGLAYNQDSVLKLTIEDANSNFTTADSEFSFFICYIPQDETDWKGLNTPFQDNTIMNNLGIDFTFTPESHSALPIVATLTGFSNSAGAQLDVIERHFEVVSPNTLEVTITFSPNADLQTFMESKDPFNRQWLYGVSVGTDETNVADSDRVTLYGTAEASEVVTPIGEFDDLTLQFTNWDGESVATPLASNVNMQPKDDVQVVGELLLDFSLPEDLTKIESRIDLYETATGNYTELDSIEIDVTDQTTTPNNVQQLNKSVQRGFNYPSAFKRERCSVSRNATLDTGTKAGYDISFCWRQRYEEWIARTGLPTAMYDNTEPNNGFNNFWRWLASGGGVGSGFELRHSILLHFDNGDVYRNPTSLTDFDYYNTREDTHRIRHFNEAKTTNLLINTTSYTSVAGTSYVVNNNAILSNANTRVSALFNSTNICQNVDFAEITLEVFEGAGYKSIWKIRTDQNPVASNNPLQPLSGQSNILITYPNPNEIELECLIDNTKIPAGANYELSAQIKTGDDCGCSSIDIIVTGSDFAGTYTTTIQGDGTFEDATGDWVISYDEPTGTWAIYYQGDLFATWKDTSECPENLEWTLDSNATGVGITQIDTEKTPTCECIQVVERILGYGVLLQLPQPQDEPREKIDCCPTLPVFASLSTNDPYKNDWNGWCYYKKAETNFDVNFKLQHCDTGEVYDLNDDTYGTFYDYGSLPVGSDYRAYYLDWQLVLGLLGEGTYRLIRVITAFGTDTNYYSCKYRLRHYADDSANRTVRVETIMSGKIEETGLDYTDVNWKHSLRFDGYFGKQQPTYEIDEVVQKDNEVKPIRSELINEYELRGDIVSDCVTSELINYHLRANNIFVSDYNRLNHRGDYKGFPVRLKSPDDFTYLSKSRKANFTITFADSKLNRIKANCGVNDIFPSSGAPQFNNSGECQPASYVVEYANGDPITSGTIPSGGNETIQVPNCADADVTVNTVTYGSAPSAGTLNVEVVDQDGNDVCSLNGSGQWEVNTGGSCLNTANPIKTGVTTSATTGDDGDLQQGRLTDWYTIEAGQDNNNFPHNYRFIGINGGYQDPTTGNYFDVDGNPSTKGVEFPSDLIVDRATYNQVTGNYLMFKHVNNSGFITTNISDCQALNLSGFTGFQMANQKEVDFISNVGDTASKDLFDYHPFNVNFGGSAGNSIRTSSLTGTGGSGDYWATYAFSNNIIISASSAFAQGGNNYKCFAVRITNISEL
jgi:hypothetical protein